MVAAAGFRVVFFGTPAFAVPTLAALLRSQHTVAGVVTQPDRPRGRGQKTTDAPIKACALEAGLPILQPPRLKDEDFLAALRALHADIGVVAAYGKILTDAVLAVPPRGMVNVHASLLPAYRGAAPVHRAVIAGDRETGVTIMRVVKALDAGPMLATVRRPIDADETSADVERDLAALGAALLVETLDRMLSGAVPEVPQDDALATYAPRLTKDDGLVDWNQPARRIHDLVRGLYPWPHAYTFLDGRRLILLRTLPRDDDRTGAAPGTIVAARGDDLRVAVATGTLAITALQAEGKRPMGAREFLLGHRLAEGSRFAAPAAAR